MLATHGANDDNGEEIRNRRWPTIQDERAIDKPFLERRPLWRVVTTVPRPGYDQLVRPRRTTYRNSRIGGYLEPQPHNATTRIKRDQSDHGVISDHDETAAEG